MSTSNGDSINAMPATSSDHDSVVGATPPSGADASTICKTPVAGSTEEPSTHNSSVASTSAEGATASEANANGTLATTADTNSNKPTADANSNKPRPSETPRANRTDGKTEELTTLRSQIALEMNNEFVECSVEVFLKHYLPFEPSEVAVEECILRLLGKDAAPTNDAIEGCPSLQQAAEPLRQSARFKTLHQPLYNKEEPILWEIILEETTALRFTDYMECLSNEEAAEKTLFTPLKSIADAVGGYSETCDGRVRNSFQYLNCQDTIISSDIRGSNNKIDACFSNGGSDLHTKYIVVPIEQKVTGANRDSNNRQVVSANVQIMNDDVRRMFTYGMTFEGDEATLWYHCRSHSAVSKQFSFIENPKLLVKVFLSFLFATDEELGYDPNVTPVEGKKRQYTFKITSSDGKSAKFYRTVKVLSEYPSNSISGRMARVWLVDRVDSEGNKIGPQCVLKDVWLGVNALTEKEIQTAIFADIEKYCHPDKPDYNLALDPPEDSPEASLNNIKMRNAELVKSGEYKQYFLEIESDHAGKPSKDVLEGCTPVTGLFQNADADRIASLNDNSIRPVGSTPFINSGQQHKRTYTPRKQYRVIFKEVCQAVGDLPTLGKVLNILKQTVIPLSLLYCAGWVHRDISSGNILAHQGGSVLRAKLSDLEYAKKFPLPEDHKANGDAKTGTPFFMPIEIMQDVYIYNRIDNKNDIAFAIRDPSLFVAKKQLAELGAPRKNTSRMSYTSVVYNFQHDLESLWTWANEVFQHDVVPTPERIRFLRALSSISLEDIMLPSISFMHLMVDYIRSAMNIAYSGRARDDTLRDTLSYAIIVDRFHFCFQLLESVSGSPWEETPLVMNIPADGPNSVQPADAATAVPSAPSLFAGCKRPNPNIGKTAPSESFKPGPADEDVEATLKRQRPKRIKM
ncbi:hypothetical protein JR316_0001358 [Psilocybe cubensis]|uniref:Uncharacterized protein n=1 Tax=Psilocybe cubensis TaxID=181762 RepID=A0ACB8HHI4_PSICU|nr:hypothetical protein JR316_0001358 [Psilocybe cubensis]KAH9487288.1 hypothetical protein JR316_0001358 [Psilocybe cubensis]